jgi:hypothetical protein
MSNTSKEYIAALLKDVTPGPWEVAEGRFEAFSSGGRALIQPKESANAVKVQRPLSKYPTTVARVAGDSAEAEANTRFIAAARELVPALAAENDALRAALTRRSSEELARLVDWLNEDEDNGALLLAHLPDEIISKARAALKVEGRG